MTAFDEPSDNPMSSGEAHERICRGLDVEGRPVDGSLLFTDESIVSLPVGLTLSGRLSISFCSRLESLPVGLTVGESVHLRDCKRLRFLPPDLALPRLHISGCRGLDRMPRGLQVDVLDVGDQLPMHYGPSTHVGTVAGGGPLCALSLGDDSVIGGSVVICSDAPLPRGLRVTGDLDLEWSGVRFVPDDLRVEGTLTIPPSAASLPRVFAGSVRIVGVVHPTLEGLRVEGDLQIVRCPYLLRVADLRCGGSVRLRDLPALVQVEDVRAAGFVDVQGCDRLRDFERVAHGLNGEPPPVYASSVDRHGAPVAKRARASIDELWRAVLDQPDDRERILVFADALLDAGDRRGELIALQCRSDPPSADEFDPTLGPDARVLCGALEPAIDMPQRAAFRLGLVRRAWVSLESEERARALLDLPDWATVEHVAFSSPIWRVSRRARRLCSVRLLPDIGATTRRADFRFVELSRDLNELGQPLPLLVVQADSTRPWSRGLALLLAESRAIEALELRLATNGAYADAETLGFLRSEGASTLREIRLAIDAIHPSNGLNPLIEAALAQPLLRRLTLSESPWHCVVRSGFSQHEHSKVSCLDDPAGYQLDYQRDVARPDTFHAMLSRTGEPRSSLETMMPLVANTKRFTLRWTPDWQPTESEVAEVEHLVARHCPALESFEVADQPLGGER
ncbi:MAG: TIGR02996 domain-containing protein [Polyangiaceae bacterium]